ncbi:MAG: FtsW/RodA/SpoVE family cell cycle protein [Rothia sp. (in: high G+C Gram-positive bacteria)]|uniref:FtsW/RodA/SpoVE family cell cycle protein n=1 Tax=Rothia sp. (in: high G+C Gram-positive bacteria) TaxID=1885016 RepID=UPI0026E056FA|nr:FtsW/RodA/SpoVE family cell cycle protein [Rothia sp. (in: high G+C Gram-positive bacteria)]MDO5751097.1 FtsW/RodA/SpoVE family cell cycle protein [Rothia sp. (in: high G+C Gram-positive bacteria)]
MSSSLDSSHAPSFVSRVRSFARRHYNNAFQRVWHSELHGSFTRILLVVLALVFFGIIMVLSASSVALISSGRNAFGQVISQGAFAVIGIGLMLGIAFTPVKWWRSNPVVIHAGFIIAIALQLLVVIAGKEVNGNKNWLSLGSSFAIQPAEFSKLFFILWIAFIISRRGEYIERYSWKVLCVTGSGLILLGALIFAGHDMGTLTIYGIIFVGMLWLSGISKSVLRWTVLVAVLAAIAGNFSSSNRIQRILALFGQCEGSMCDQSNAGVTALATGGIWGVMLGQSRQKYSYLPEAHTDYIFAVIGEELGLVGTLAVLVMYAFLFVLAVQIMVRTSDTFVRMTTGGITIWLGSQALINMFMVAGVLPVIGVPLPFISYGGSSLISSLLAAGVLLAFARNTSVWRVAWNMPADSSERQMARNNKLLDRRSAYEQMLTEENAKIAANEGNFPAVMDRVLAWFGWGEKAQKPAPSAGSEVLSRHASRHSVSHARVQSPAASSTTAVKKSSPKSSSVATGPRTSRLAAVKKSQAGVSKTAGSKAATPKSASAKSGGVKASAAKAQPARQAPVHAGQAKAAQAKATQPKVTQPKAGAQRKATPRPSGASASSRSAASRARTRSSSLPAGLRPVQEIRAQQKQRPKDR